MKNVSVMTAMILAAAFTLTSACASKPHVVKADSPSATLKLSAGDLAKIDKTIAALNSEIDELQNLNDKMYEKSLTADPQIEKEFERKKSEYGSFESLQANLKILKELKTAAR